MDIPVLITAWRRVEKLEKLLFAIKENKPKKLYFSCDGPRENNKEDEKLIKIVQEKFDKLITWDCEVYKRYNNQNLGCRRAMIGAIDWFFNNESEGIILEDDCIPKKEFLPYCKELLKKHRKNHKVWNISGTNLQKEIKRGEGSYYLSKYFHCWGWATWKDRWLKIDSLMSTWPKIKNLSLLKSVFTDPVEFKYWNKIFDKFYFENVPDTWDIEWAYTCFINKGYTIIPNQNLIKNIGFDQEATHTKFSIEKMPGIDSKPFLPLNHPNLLIQDNLADRFTFYNHYGMNFKRRLKFIFKKPLYYPKKVLKLIIHFFVNIF